VRTIICCALARVVVEDKDLEGQVDESGRSVVTRVGALIHSVNTIISVISRQCTVELESLFDIRALF
jgi:hypothetical protein